jgi:serine/threonine-protein kinase HipA
MSQFTGTALAVWCLVDPANPKIVGEVRLEAGFRRCLLELDKRWQSEGFRLSPEMDLSKTLHAPLADLFAPGALDDAMPDRWGERMIRVISRPTRMSPLDKLWFAGIIVSARWVFPLVSKNTCRIMNLLC